MWRVYLDTTGLALRPWPQFLPAGSVVNCGRQRHLGTLGFELCFKQTNEVESERDATR